MRPPFLMKIKCPLFTLIASFAMAMPFALHAEGNSTSMGFLSAVVSDGAFDATRNPALLGLQTSHYAAGVMVNSGPLSKMDVDMYDTGMSFDSLKEFFLQTGAVFTFKSGIAVFGVALSSVNKEDFYKNSEAEISIRGHIDEMNADTDGKITQKEKKYAPAIVFSAAFPLSPTTFFGVQGSLGIMTDEVNRHGDVTVLLAVPQSFHSDMNVQTKAYTFEVGAGLLKKIDRGQVGLLIRSGELYSSTSDADYTANFSPSDTESSSNPLRYVSGMSIAAGFYMQPVSSFGFAFETEYRFPAEYRDNILEEEDGHIEENPYMVTLGGGFQFKAGAEWSGISNLRLSAGIFVSFQKKEKIRMFHEEGDDRPSDEYEKQKFIGLTCGGSYRLHDAYLFTLTAGYLRGDFAQERGDRKFMDALYERFFLLVAVNVGF